LSEAGAIDMIPAGTPPFERERPGILGRILHGIGAGAVATALGIASNLLLLPLYLHSWTVAVYGEWMALYSVVNYLSTLDFGVTTAAVNAATMAYARANWPQFKRIQGTAWAASCALSALGALFVAVILAFFHVNRWLGLKTIGPHQSQLVFGYLAVALLIGIPGRQLGATFIALGEYAKYQWIYNAGVVLQSISIGIALLLGARPATLAAVVAIIALSSVGGTYGLIWWRNSRLIPRLRDAEWSTARALAAPTGQFGVQMAATALMVQGPVVILSRVLGGPAVALFTTTRTVVNAVRGVLVLVRAPLRPELAAAATQAAKRSLRSLFRIAVAVDTAMAITLAACLWTGGIWLIRFWSHGHIPPDPLLLHLLLMFSLLEGFLGILSSVGTATNRLSEISIAQLAYALVSLVLAAALMHHLGPSAVPIGAIVPLLVFVLPAAIRNARNEVELRFRYLIVRMLLPFAAVVAFLGIVQSRLLSLHSLPEWVSASIASLATCLIACVVVGTAFITGNDRSRVLSRAGAFTQRS
jgi:O-antigen/teichoic acid export membrane protein